MGRLECSLKTKKYFETKYYPVNEYDKHRQHSKYIPFSLPLSKIIKEAFELLEAPNELRIDVVDNEWLNMSEIIGNSDLKNVVPMIDMSFLSEHTDGYYTAIGMAILVAERSTLGRRIIVIDNQLSWINIENEQTLFAMIKKIKSETKSRISTANNLDSVLNELMRYIDESKLSNKKIEDLSLVYYHTQSLDEHLHEKIIKTFYEGGLIGSRNLPFPCPRMIYWNLSKTQTTLPSLINSKNSVLLSGYSAILIRNLNLLQKNNYDTINEIIKHYNHPKNID